MGDERITEAAVGLAPLGAGTNCALDGVAGREFRVVLIREGLAKSGRYFTRRVVDEIGRAAEGLRAFADHPTRREDRERPVRSVRDVVGFYRDGRTVEVEGGRCQAEATLHVFEGAAWLAAMAREGLECGAPDVVGLSIDALCVVRPGKPMGMTREVAVAESLLELKSVDVVTRPSAGGRFLEMKESEEMEMDGVGCEATGESGGSFADPRPQWGGPWMTAGREVASEALTKAERVLAAVREAEVSFACRQALGARLAEAELPEPVVGKLRRQWAHAAGTWDTVEDYERALEGAIEMEREAVGQLKELFAAEVSGGQVGGVTSPVERSLVTGVGSARVDVDGVERQRLAVQLGLDRLFGVRESDDDAEYARARHMGLLPSVPRWKRLREAYTQITGDWEVSGLVVPDASVVREANEVTTGVLNFALLNSMTKRLVQDYAGQPQEWRKLCAVQSLTNFKSQDRVKLHDFSSLSTVAEGAAYTNLAWDDSREAYAPSKRGNLVVVTREAILNDDLRAITKIPQKLAVAAGITMNEFVYGLFTSNPFMSDGSKVFDDGVQVTHLNRGTTALSSAALQAAITSMLKQTNTAGKRLNLRPRYLLVPPDLLFTALTLVNSTLIPGSANNDANVLKGAVEPISVAQLTDATDYYLVCDPGHIESLEIGFVNGREAPELLMQDRPDQGQVFTNDQVAYKVRWEFGGGWLDYRGAFWGNVAG